MRKEPIVLKDVSNPPLAGRNVHPGRPVEENPIASHDAPVVAFQSGRPLAVVPVPPDATGQQANALDMDDDRQIRVSVQGSHNSEAADNPDSGDFGSRVTLAYKQKLMDDTVGISLGYARLKEPTVSSRFVGLQFDPGNPAYDGLDEFRDEHGNLLISDGFELNEQGGENKRDSFVAAFDYAPTDDLKMRLDGFYSELLCKERR